MKIKEGAARLYACREDGIGISRSQKNGMPPAAAKGGRYEKKGTVAFTGRNADSRDACRLRRGDCPKTKMNVHRN